MLLSIVAWDSSQREACETKIRTELSIAGYRTADAPGKMFNISESSYGRAAEAVRWTLSGHDKDASEERFVFTTLMPAYALSDAAESCDLERPGSGDNRLITLQLLWDQLQPIDVAVIVRRRLGNGQLTDETLVDAARDLAKLIVVATQEDVWSAGFGAWAVKQLLKGTKHGRGKSASKDGSSTGRRAGGTPKAT